jgi:hypothetical protein
MNTDEQVKAFVEMMLRPHTRLAAHPDTAEMFNLTMASEGWPYRAEPKGWLAKGTVYVYDTNSYVHLPFVG